MEAAVFVIVWVLCAGFAALIANAKGRSVGGFAVAGFLLGPIGLLWAAFANPHMSRAEQRRQDELDRAFRR